MVAMRFSYERAIFSGRVFLSSPGASNVEQVTYVQPVRLRKRDRLSRDMTRVRRIVTANIPNQKAFRLADHGNKSAYREEKE